MKLLRWLALAGFLALILIGAEWSHRAWINRVAGPTFERTSAQIGKD